MVGNETSFFRGSPPQSIRCWGHETGEGCCLATLFVGLAAGGRILGIDLGSDPWRFPDILEMPSQSPVE